MYIMQVLPIWRYPTTYIDGVLKVTDIITEKHITVRCDKEAVLENTEALILHLLQKQRRREIDEISST